VEQVTRETLAERLTKEIRAAFQEGHDRGYDRRRNCDQPQGGIDWRDSRARVRLLELEQEISTLEKRGREAEQALEFLDRVRCAYCGTWAHADDVVEDQGPPYCVDCYDSWPFECETLACGWRLPAAEEDAEECPECGGKFIPVAEKQKRRQAARGGRECE